MVMEHIKRSFLRWYPETFVVLAHMGGTLLCIWMERYDLLAAGIAFGIPSALLFRDLLPGGRGLTVKIIRWMLRL
ncbi:MAG: hypothetical protein JW939_02250 [Candidatus Thermoplasmatota archaeon]|nr:hypothetical protein [Candidatus Thermoplasmatota archaeon]